MSKRPVQELEAEQQARWKEAGLSRANDASNKPKFFMLVEFPFPSGEGLHTGHIRSYTAFDAFSRKKRMQGYNVLYPMGWDAFGLPTENYSIKTKTPPQDVTKRNTDNFRRQLQSMGMSFDWSREINTTDPAYYKWTQWQFLQFLKHGLAYKAKSTINWCPNCKIGLANEEAQGGVCERCGGPVEEREKEQWMLRITRYADRLISDLDTVDYLPKIKAQQVNWIGKSEGATVAFVIPAKAGIHPNTTALNVFTTRPDTLFGVTFLVISPELAKKWMSDGWSASDDVRAYVEHALKQTDEERTADREKTGVDTGVRAVHPFTKEELPVWVADYVLGGYGTGAIMAVPAHDERDRAFAEKFGLPKKEVVLAPLSYWIENSFDEREELRRWRYGSGQTPETEAMWQEKIDQGYALYKKAAYKSESSVCYDGLGGTSINSDFLDGKTTEDAKKEMIARLEVERIGNRSTTYKLRDWVFSRQRYWGEPIPLVKCESCAKTKQKALLVHGFAMSAETPCISNLRHALEQAGFEIIAPSISNPQSPDTELWTRELAPHVATLGENDIILGHSIGGKMVVHALVESKKKIRALFLLAPTIGTRTKEDWDAFKARRPEVDPSVVDRFAECWNEPLPLEEVSALVERKEVIWSRDDKRVPCPTRNIYGDDWYIHLTDGAGHFVSDTPNTELNETLCSAKITGWVPLPESSLPLTLPPIEAYVPSENGESPLANIKEWVNTTCPRCGGPAMRETDTMPNWAGSSWYFLRYADPHNDKEFASKEALRQWLPVDLYNGGMEHTTLHLLYSRFWYKFLWDTGAIPEECGNEPYKARRSHGLVLAEGGEKMSKSKGNVVNPDDVVKEYGADVLRVYELFMGPFDQPVPWDTNGIEGVRKFLDKVWALFVIPAKAGIQPVPSVDSRLDGNDKEGYGNDKEMGGNDDAYKSLDTLYHQTLKKITDGIESLAFNTCVSQLMILTNAYQEAGGVPCEHREGFLQMLAPFAPHLADAIWENEGHATSIHMSAWPAYDATKLQSSTFELVIQVNGKVRDRVTVPSDITEEDAKAQALASEKVQAHTKGLEPKQILYVKGRLVNIVI